MIGGTQQSHNVAIKHLDIALLPIVVVRHYLSPALIRDVTWRQEAGIFQLPCTHNFLKGLVLLLLVAIGVQHVLGSLKEHLYLFVERHLNQDAEGGLLQVQLDDLAEDLLDVIR